MSDIKTEVNILNALMYLQSDTTDLETAARTINHIIAAQLAAQLADQKQRLLEAIGEDEGVTATSSNPTHSLFPAIRNQFRQELREKIKGEE